VSVANTIAERLAACGTTSYASLRPKISTPLGLSNICSEGKQKHLMTSPFTEASSLWSTDERHDDSGLLWGPRDGSKAQLGCQFPIYQRITLCPAHAYHPLQDHRADALLRRFLTLFYLQLIHCPKAWKKCVVLLGPSSGRVSLMTTEQTLTVKQTAKPPAEFAIDAQIATRK
jgi:hypothetical protein